MVALTYGDARVTTPESETATKNTPKAAVIAAPRQSFFARLLTAMMEARMRQAEREIRLHTRLLPRVRSEQDRLPFGNTETPRGGW